MPDSWADAFMRLRVDQRLLKRDVEDALRQVDATTSGRKTGETYGRQFAEEVTRKAGKVPVGVDTGKATLDVKALQARIAEMAAKAAKIPVDLNDTAALLKVGTLNEKLDALSRKTVTPDIKLGGYYKALAEVKTLSGELDKLGRKGGGPLAALLPGGKTGTGGGLLGMIGNLVPGLAGTSGGASGLGALAPASAGLLTNPYVLAGGATLAAGAAPFLGQLAGGGLIGGLGAGIAGLGIAGAVGVGAGKQPTAAQMTAARDRLIAARARQAALGSKATTAQRATAAGAVASAQGQVSTLTQQQAAAPTAGQQRVRAAFGKVGDQFKGDLTRIGQSFVGPLTEIAGQVSKVMTKLTPVFATATKIVSGPFKTFADTLIKALGQPAVQTSIKAVATAFGDILKAMAPTLPGMVKDIADGITNIAGAISKNPHAFSGFISFLGQLIEMTLKAIGWLTNVATYIEQHFGPALHRVAVIWDGVRHEVMHILDQLFGYTVGVVIRLAHNVEAQFNNLKQWIWNDFLLKIYDFFVKTLPHWWDLTVAFAKSLWTRIAGAFTAGWNHVWSATITPIAGFFTKTLPGWWNAVWTAAKLLWTRLGQAFTAGWNWVWQHTVVPVRTFFTATLPGWWNFVWTTTKLLWTRVGGAFTAGWNWVWSHTLGPMATLFTKTLPGWFDTAVRKVGEFWTKLGTITRKPVAWVINNVLNGLIGAFDWITSHVGLGSPIKKITGWATGGRITAGTGPTADDVLIRVSRGETVLSAAHSAVLSPALAAVGVPGYQAGGKVGQHAPAVSAAQARFGTSVNPTGGAPIPGGGVLHNIGHAISAGAHKALDVAKITAAFATGNREAFMNAFADLVGLKAPGAGGAVLSQILTQIPKTIAKGLVDWIMGKSAASQASGSGADIAKFAETFLGKIPYTWGAATLTAADCSGFVQAVYKHFGINAPRTSEAQGAWVKRTGPQSGGLAFYHSPPGGPDPGHVAIIKNAGTVISQGGGMGPKLQAIRYMPLLWTGVPPGGFGGSAAGGHGGVPANAAAMAGYFAAHGFTRNAIAGLLGNIYQESGGNPMAGTNPPGRGLIQILGDPGGSLAQELDRTMAYIRANGSVADINAHSPSAAAAATWFCNRYERPGIPALANRIAAANASYAAGYANGGWIQEPVTGVGKYSGALYSFGEAGRELVIPEAQARGGGDGGSVVAELRALRRTLEHAPARTAGGVAAAINAQRGTEAQAARRGAR